MNGQLLVKDVMSHSFLFILLVSKKRDTRRFFVVSNYMVPRYVWQCLSRQTDVRAARKDKTNYASEDNVDRWVNR